MVCVILWSLFELVLWPGLLAVLANVLLALRKHLFGSNCCFVALHPAVGQAS